MEKFVLTPIKVFDKIAKYSPENAKINMLVNADAEKEQVENAQHLDPVTKSFLTSLKRKDVELHRKKVFPVDENYKLDPINKNYQNKSNDIEEEGRNSVDADGENLPPLNSSHTETIGPDQKYILSLLENDPTFELHENQTYTLGKKTHRNIHETLNHITRSRTSERLQPVDGTEAVLRALGQNNDNLDLNKISLRQDMRDKVKKYQTNKQIETKSKKMGGANRRLIFIDKLPFKI